ncbi:peptidase family C50-domain-containing protein [Lipomyces oligophaga]|uniref:peptidase family C50-domain-containing protein n=1 Tax=Lipomyces oligophaga TaxID=45792 RepID=UPI0034CD4C85
MSTTTSLDQTLLQCKIPSKASRLSGSCVLNRTLLYVTHTRVLLEQKLVLPDADEFVRKLSIPVQLDKTLFEKLLVEIDNLRRAAIKLFSNKCSSLIFGMLNLMVHYGQQAPLPVYIKVSTRILDTNLTYIKPLVLSSFDDPQTVLQILQSSATLCTVINDHRSTSYLSAASFNYGINLWKRSLKNYAVIAWQISLDLDWSCISEDQPISPNQIRTAQRLGIAYSDVGQFSRAVEVLHKTVEMAISSQQELIAEQSGTVQLEHLVENAGVTGLLTALAKATLNLSTDVGIISFSALIPICRGILLEYLLLQISSIRHPKVPNLMESLFTEIDKIYFPSHPALYSRSLLSFLSTELSDECRQRLLGRATRIVTILQHGNSGEFVSSSSKISVYMACLWKLHLAIFKSQSDLLQYEDIQCIVTAWTEVFAKLDDLRSFIFSQEVLLRHIDLVYDFLNLQGEKKQLLRFLKGLTTLSDKFSMSSKYHIELGKLYITLGNAEKASNCFVQAQRMDQNDQLIAQAAQIHYGLSMGNMEHALESVHVAQDLANGLILKSGTPTNECFGSIFCAFSQVLKMKGRQNEALAFAKAAVKLYSNLAKRVKSDFDKSLTSGTILASSIYLLDSYRFVSDLYDHLGMARETEFYLLESLKLAGSMHSLVRTSVIQYSLADFYLRSGNIAKAEVHLAHITNDKIFFNDCLQSVQYWHLMASLSELSKDFDSVLGCFEKAESLLDTELDEINEADELSNMLKSLTINRRTQRSRSTSRQKQSTTARPISNIGLQRMYATHFLIKASYLLRLNKCKCGEEAISKAMERFNMMSMLPRDKAFISSVRSRLLFKSSMMMLQKDPILGVLQDSALSIPSALVLIEQCHRSDKSSEKSDSKLHRGQPLRSKATKNLQAAFKGFESCRQLILDGYSTGGAVCSVSERRSMTAQVGEILLLQSAIGYSDEADAFCSATSYLLEQPKCASFNSEAQAADSQDLLTIDFGNRTDSSQFEKNVIDLDHFQHSYVDIIPNNWKVVSITYAQDSEDLIISRFQANESPLLIRLPLDRRNSRDADEELFTFSEALVELRRIVSESNQTAQDSKSIQRDDREGRERWWELRHQLDRQLERLLTNIEYSWIGGFRGILGYSYRSHELLDKFNTSFMAVLRKHLPTRRKAVSRVRRSTSSQKEPTLLNREVQIDPRVLELFVGLGICSNDDYSEMIEDLLYFVLDILQFHGERNAYDELDIDQMVIEVQDIIQSYYESVQNLEDAREDANGERTKTDHTVLILDKTVQMIPWESLPCLRNQSVSRVPSLEFLREILTAPLTQKANMSGLDKDNVSYILNPSGDLINTRNRFDKQLIESENWTGLIDKEPSEQEFGEYLRNKDILLYFGHGGGEQYIRPQQIKNLRHGTCAATFLFGCSSGCLKEAGEFESWGTPMNYFTAKCPMFVCNLWDVTDKDIDKFANEMLASWGLFNRSEKKPQIEHRSTGAGYAMARARDTCILKYLNGAAPVMYGIPLKLA